MMIDLFFFSYIASAYLVCAHDNEPSNAIFPNASVKAIENFSIRL